ncbi:MAG TPA: 5'-nucleotidase [Polyangiaceae bacterium]|nr:5'-nucleotidase [Polyangiaceae bacterium]
MQLELPYLPGSSLSVDRSVTAPRRVYVCRDLKLSRIDWVGFDMDYTLAIYHQEEMDRLSVDATVDKLIAKGYPAWLRDLHYPLDFPIRGLLIDKKLGNVLKMNRFKIVRRGYHGLRELTREEIRALYYERKIRHKSDRFHWIDTLYGLSEACTFATVVDAYDERGKSIAYAQLFTDIRSAIDEAHRDGTILEPVMADPARFIERDELLGPTLHKLRSAGKRLFVLTNSRHTYTDVLLSYLLDGMLPDYPTYKHYFDAIIVAAQKPAFFQKNNPLLERRGQRVVPAQLPLERGKIYENGNLRELQKALGVTGNRVVYVGDHIYGDMLRSKKDSAWRTAMVIPELEAEVVAVAEGREDQLLAGELYARRHELEEILRQHQRRLKDAAKKNGNGNGHVSSETQHLKQVIVSIRKQLHALDEESARLLQRIDGRFHPYWGSLLKERNELSLFGAQVSDYSCVYTSRVSNLFSYSPHQYFRSPHNKLHHEL